MARLRRCLGNARARRLSDAVPRATRRNHTLDGTRSYAESAPRHDASVSYLYLYYYYYYYSYVCCFIQGIARAVTSRCVERFVVCICVGVHHTGVRVRRGGAVPYGENAVGKEQVSYTRVRTRKHAHYTWNDKSEKVEKKNYVKRAETTLEKTFTCQMRINYVLHCEQPHDPGTNGAPGVWPEEVGRERGFKIGNVLSVSVPRYSPPSPAIDGIRKTVNSAFLFFQRQTLLPLGGRYCWPRELSGGKSIVVWRFLTTD